jgi:hypothetical protein
VVRLRVSQRRNPSTLPFRSVAFGKLRCVMIVPNSATKVDDGRLVRTIGCRYG